MSKKKQKKVRKVAKPVIDFDRFPKLPGKAKCLGFRKTVLLNLEEYKFLNQVIGDALRNESFDDRVTNVLNSIRAKLSAPTLP